MFYSTIIPDTNDITAVATATEATEGLANGLPESQQSCEYSLIFFTTIIVEVASKIILLF